MKPINAILAPLTWLTLATASAPAAEMTDMPDMKKMPPTKTDAGKPTALQAHKGQGTVNSVDARAGKVNLTHGPIATLKWPGMTMDFAVKDRQALARLTPGQKVNFMVIEQPKGQYVITEISPAK